MATTPATRPRVLMSLPEAAAALGIGRHAARRLFDAGRLSGYVDRTRQGERVTIFAASVAALLRGELPAGTSGTSAAS